MADIICSYSLLLQQTTIASCSGSCGDNGKVDGHGEFDPVDPWVRESGLLSLSCLSLPKPPETITPSRIEVLD
jgi:hypothetical protein